MVDKRANGRNVKQTKLLGAKQGLVKFLKFIFRDFPAKTYKTQA
jgi:hypothetical protein